MVNTIILFGSLHGFFLSTVLTIKGFKARASSNAWLGAVLFFLSLYLLEHYFILSGRLVHHAQFTLMTYPSLFFIGPLILIYTHSLVKKTLRPQQLVGLLLPGLIIYTAFIPAYLTDQSTAPFFSINVPAGAEYLKLLLHPLVFTLFTPVFIIGAYFKIRKNPTAYSHNNWLKIFLYSLLAFSAINTTICIIAPLIHRPELFDWCVQLLLLCLIIHSVGYKAIMDPSTFTYRKIEKPEKYQTSSINSEMSKVILSEIQSLMKEEKVFLSNKLTIQKLAEQTGFSRHKISQVINQELSMTFLDFINRYRIDEAKKMLLEDACTVKINQLALDVGFNNKVSFYRAFNKFTGTSPGNFQQNQLKTVTSDQL